MKTYSKIFLWMFIGLLVTFITGIYVSTNENILTFLFQNNGFIIVLIAELITVIFLTARIKKMSPTTARISFLLYSFLTGLTFSSIFLIYELGSILLIFLVASLLFGIFALIGNYTSIDLTKLGTYLLMMLFGIIICTLINIFLNNSIFDIIITIISLIIFLGYVAYDIQKIKLLEDEIEEDNLAIYGALQLYLDFINILLDLLNLFGKNRD